MLPTSYTADDVEQLAARFENAPADEVLTWALEAFESAIGYACSFGAEGMVLIDMLARIGKPVRVFTLDTGRLPQETYGLIETVRERYGLAIEVYAPDTSAVQLMVRTHGPNLFYRDVELRKLCCHVRKVEPLRRALHGLDAWIAGLRREQAATRAMLRKVELDPANGGLLKVHPLADWSWNDVWDYIRRNDVPYNPLHDRGYTSIGCAPCTRAIRPDEVHRAGRWWWERDAQKECGLHPAKLTRSGSAA